MAVLYISPEFPANYANFILQLERLGANVWAMGEADFFDMPAPLRNAMRYYVRTDLNSTPAVEKALEVMLNAKTARATPRRFDLVESHNETWLELEAHINAIPDMLIAAPIEEPR